MNEIWKEIPGYEGIYEASSLGRIRSAAGKTTSNARYAIRVWQSRVLKQKRPISAKRRDARVSLWKNGKPRDHLVARLVASAFLGAPIPGMTVNHINGNYEDNRPENLEWLPLADNIKKGFETGLFDSISTPVDLTDEFGNLTIHFSSMSQASRFLGRNDSYVSSALARGRRRVRSSGGTAYAVCRVRSEDDMT